MSSPDIRFPHLGIEFNHVLKGFKVFGFPITMYAVIIAFGMLMGLLIAEWQAKRTGQDQETYLDLALYCIVFAVIGARLYYVIFAWGQYKDDLLSVFNIKGGGLAIYGGVIGGALTVFVYSRLKKKSFWLLADTACLGLILGQAIGRWGNFVNREAFGGYTNSLFAMQVKEAEVYASSITQQMRDHVIVIQGERYIQVHPTFLYESIWNILVLVMLILFTKHKKRDGELFLLYLVGYGLGRVWIEGMRTDQLFLWGTSLPVSQLLSGSMVILATALFVLRRKKSKS